MHGAVFNMASKTGGLSVGAVNERRLRPIYDHLDNGNNKNALHEAEKLLKKQKDLLAAKVLKTIALQRLDRVDEAFALSQEVTSLEPADENSLQGLSLYYREIDRTDLIPPIYEAAVKKCPGNEEYKTHLFMAYVRTEKYKDMQRVALALYKQHPKNPYLFWAIMAIVMQAGSDEKMGKKMFLPLAEKMIEKHIEKGKIEAEAEVRLYLMVLEMLQKYEKSLEVLQGHNSNSIRFILDKENLSQIKLDIYGKLGKWEKVNAENKRKMEDNPDIWNHILGYLGSLNYLIEAGWKPEDSKDDVGTSLDVPDYKWGQGAELVLGLIGAENGSKVKRRGPYLARLEMITRLRNKDADEDTKQALEKLGDFVSHLCDYLAMFGTKPCCFTDLQTYARSLTQAEMSEFLDHLSQQERLFPSFESQDENLDDKEAEKKILEHLTIVKLQRFLGHHEKMNKEGKLGLVADFLRRHKEGEKYSAYRLETDLPVVDDYCQLAANLLIDIYQEEGDVTQLWRAVYVLEIAKQRSPSNFKFKVTLIRLYSLLGVFMPCAPIYDSLEIKHMQQDTLGYIVSHSVSALGHYQLASQAFEASRAYFVSNNKDSLEFLIACFRNGTFHKVFEFVEFRHRVKNSLHSTLTLTEHTHMDLVTQADVEIPFFELCDYHYLAKEAANYDKLTDNRDFRLQFDWLPEKRELTSTQIQTSFDLEKDWLLFRELQVKSTIVLIHHMRAQEVSESAVRNYNIDDMIRELEIVVEKSINNHDLLDDIPFHGPPSSRGKIAKEVGYQKTTLAILKLFHQIQNDLKTKGKSDLHRMSEAVIKGVEESLNFAREGLSQPKVGGEKNTSRRAGNRSQGNCCPDNHGDDAHGGCHDNCSGDSLCVVSMPEKDAESALSMPVPDALLGLRRSKLERLVLSCEMFSLVVLLTYNMRTAISELKAETMKKRKRKKEKQEPLPSIVQFFQEFLNDLKQLGQNVKSTLLQMECDAELIKMNFEAMDLGKDGIPNGEHEDLGIPPKSGEAPKKAKPLVEQLVHVSSESILNSTDQLHRVVEGRLNNLKAMKI